MAEKILVTGATEIFKKLGGFVSEQIGLAWGVQNDLEKLQSTIEMIQAVIANAEKRQDKEELVRLWLKRLRDVAYDSDDIIDEFSYEAMRRCHRGDRLKHKVLDFASSSNPLAFHFRMAGKIRDINQRLKEITNDISRFQLQITTPIIDYGGSTEQLGREATSHVIESEIVGRKNDESNIVKLLTTDFSSSTSSFTNSNNQYLEKVSVISIVGMGGLGKTTLAQLVYNDKMVQKLFELTIWVRVSENFDIEILLVNIMESITESKFHKVSNFNVLVNTVKKELNGKKYLLVLDDLWNEDSEKWESLKSLLFVGAQGSKILITTRKNQVASIVRGSIPPYKLKQLQDDSCWSIIERKAFSPGGALNAPEMINIGKEIAKRCGGLPLAAKFLGSLLHSKNKESDWKSIRDDDSWNTPDSQRKILAVLKLSYNNLPSHLKQCFSFCSIFPKNWEIKRKTLIQLWMAEGFLKPSLVGNKRSIEDLGNEYFESLVRSSFFHHQNKNYLGDIKTCKMHDLVHDLAEDVLGDNELVSLKVSKLNDISEVCRLRLKLDEDISATFLKNFSNAKKLRTIFLPEGSNQDPSIFSGNKHLRVLHIGPSPDRVSLNSAKLVFKLKHLRYLHLHGLNLKQVLNDQTIHRLYNLETLVLTSMVGVQILLRHIQFLQKLRHLEISYTYIEELPDSVTSLRHLQALDLRHNESLVAFPDSATGLKHLRYLNMSFNPIEEIPAFVLTLSNLQILKVNNCKNLKALPEYVPGFDNLKIFCFKGCILIEELPMYFGLLTQLRSLVLRGTQIRVLPESCVNLYNLEYVHLGWCELPRDVMKWTRLRNFVHYKEGTPVGIGKLVSLQELHFWVPKNGTSKSGRSDDIEQVVEKRNDGIEELEYLNLLEHLYIFGVQNVRHRTDAEKANLEGKQNLQILVLSWDEDSGKTRDQKVHSNLVFEALRPPTNLRELGISQFMRNHLPKWMDNIQSCLPNLERLVLYNCKKIQQLPVGIGQLPHLKVLQLTGIPMWILDIQGFPALVELYLTDMFYLEELCYSYPYLRHLSIDSCKRLTWIPQFPCLKNLVLKNLDYTLAGSLLRTQISITNLYLENVEALILFPVSILQDNCNLELLEIKECGSLRSFQDPKFQIGSLSQLVLRDCPGLKFLPDFPGWTSLQILTIYNCPQVKKFLMYDLRSLYFLQSLYVDFYQLEEQPGRDPCRFEDLIDLIRWN